MALLLFLFDFVIHFYLLMHKSYVYNLRDSVLAIQYKTGIIYLYYYDSYFVHIEDSTFVPMNERSTFENKAI